MTLLINESHVFLNSMARFEPESPLEEAMGRDNFVEMDLFNAMALMSTKQKDILNELAFRGGKFSLIRVAIGEGRERQGTLRLCVQRSIAFDSAHIDISPRGKVTGMVFDHPWATDERKALGDVEVKSLRDLTSHYGEMGLTVSG